MDDQFPLGRGHPVRRLRGAGGGQPAGRNHRVRFQEEDDERREAPRRTLAPTTTMAPAAGPQSPMPLGTGWRMANNRPPGTTTTAEHAECTAPPDLHDADVECGSTTRNGLSGGSPTQGVGVDRNKTRGAGERSEPGTVQRDAARSPTGSAAPPGGHAQHIPTIDELAALADVSRRTMCYTLRVRKEAPELREAMDRGEVTVSDADAIRQRPENERRAALEAVRRGDVKTLQRYFGQQPRVVRFAASFAARAERYIARAGLEMTFQHFAENVVLVALEQMEEAEKGGRAGADLHSGGEE